MEIQSLLKKYHKQLHFKHSLLVNNLKEIKIIFNEIEKQPHSPRIYHLKKQNISPLLKEVQKNILLQHKKVLQAYIDCHFDSIAQSQPHLHAKFNPKINYSFSSNQKINRNSMKNQNKLLQLFFIWFRSNYYTSQHHNKISDIFLSETIKQSQQILKHFQSLNLEQKQFEEQHQNSKNLNKNCEITLLLTILIQINLSILNVQQLKFPVAKLLIQKAQNVLKKISRQMQKKDEIILLNARKIQKIKEDQQKQLKNYQVMQKPTKQSKSTKKIKINQQKEASNQPPKEEDQQQVIKKRYGKMIEQDEYKNNIIIQEKVKHLSLINTFKQIIIRIYSAIIFSGQPRISKLKDTKYPMKLFENQKLNKAFNKHINSLQPTKQQFSDLIFNQQNLSSERSIYLSVSKNKKTIEISLKDYFNLCLFLKKINKNKQAIINFQILVYYFKKKDILLAYCLRKKCADYEKSNRNQQKFQSKDHQKSLKDKSKLEIFVKHKKQLQKFLKSQESITILIFSLINLYQLYELENAHHWSVKALQYLSEIIQKNILTYLKSIQSFFNTIESPNVNNDFSQNLTQNQQICSNLIKKYAHYIEEIKYKHVKSSLYLLSFDQNKFKTNENHQKSHLIRSLDSNQRSFRTSAPLSVTLNMKKLNQKQTQLIHLIQQKNNLKSHSNLNSMNCLKTSQNLQKTNLIKFSNKNHLTQAVKKLKKDTKGSAYERSTYKTQQTFKKTLIKTKPQKSIKEKSQNKQEKDQVVPFKRKNEVKFSLSPPQFLNASQSVISTLKSIDSRIRSSKKHTLKFLQTSKSINTSRKSARMVEFHQKLLQNKDELQEYIKLSFFKLDSTLKNAYTQTISLDEIKIQNLDNSLRMNEILNDFNSLLESLRTLKSFTEESFQRQLLIEAKIRVYEMIKSKSHHSKLIEILSNLLQDINLVRNNDKKTQLKKKILNQLAVNYFNLKQYKKCIGNYIQLGKMGESLCYLKVGEIYMLTKDYENAIKYHERYANERNFDLQSKVKLAHAYSKVPQYYMKTVDMLTNLLIASGSSSKFRQQIYQRKYDDRLIESAVILLSSLYFKNQNIQKAIQLCESYSKINIKNYRVLHILGGYYRYKNNDRKAFQCYLNALENNPTHHKSLIELTEFICAGSEYKTHAIQLLRKCYCLQSRNIDLLTTLIKFLNDDSNDQNDQQQQKFQINYKMLLKYAEILKHSQSKGYSGYNFYTQAALVYEWALSILQKSACLANLDQIQQIYRNLGEICLKQGDYYKSQGYYKLYLIEIEKQVNYSNLNQSLREEKIQKTKIEVYFFLGKVKKHQKAYKKAIDYFTKSYQLQLKYHMKLSHFESYFYLFQIGYCYFYLQDYQLAIIKFLKQKTYVLTLVSVHDPTFFQDEIKSIAEIPSYLKIEQIKELKIKKNYLKDVKIDQNQTLQNTYPQNEETTQDIGHVLKRNYLENQLHLAFCYDKLNRFIESKEIYKKVLYFFKQVESYTQERLKNKKAGKRKQSKDNQRSRQSYFKKIISPDGRLNQQYMSMKKACLINLATIYQVQGIQNKYDELIKQCKELCPQNFTSHLEKSSMMVENERSEESEESSGNDQDSQRIKQRKTIGSLLKNNEKNVFSVSFSDIQDN